MSYIQKLLSILSIGASAASVSLLQKFLAGIVVVLALTVISAVLVAALLVAAMYSSYLALVAHGVDPAISAAIVAGISLAITAIFLAITVNKIGLLKAMPSQMPVFSLPDDDMGLKHILGVAQGFWKGFTQPRNPTSTSSQIQPEKPIGIFNMDNYRRKRYKTIFFNPIKMANLDGFKISSLY